MSFGGLILTINGRNELAKAELGEVFQFTEVVLGDGEFRGSFSNKTSLEHEVMRLSITSIKRKESEVIVECDFDSKSVQQTFYFREIGIVGNGKLCYYDNAGADAEYIDPESSTIVKQKRLRFVLAISSEVELNVALAEGLYALDQDLKQVEAKIPAAVRVKGNAEGAYRTGDVNLTAENIGLGNVPNVSTNNQTPTFTQASGRVNIGSGERLSVIFGKIMKWFADLKTVAFSGKYTDLTDKPTIPAAVRVKGNAEGAYRTGDVNLTAENIGLGNVPNVSTNNQTPTFTQASGRVNIGSGERLSVIFGKIMKWFADLKTVAFSGKYTDLTDKPTIPAAVRVKGNAESAYRTGNVNLTAENIGALPYFDILDAFDANTVTRYGIYGLETYMLSNFPKDSHQGVLLHVMNTQLYLPPHIYEKNCIYIRDSWGGTWSNWTLITDTYLPLSGGTITGNLRLKGSGNYGNTLNFGDGDYVHISEPTDDHLEIKGSYINFVTSATGTGRFTLNGKDILTIDKIYPVGSIYMSVNSTNPGTLFGGTWVRWGNGRALVSVNESETEFNSVEKVGGEKTHVITTAEMPSHTHSVKAQTVTTSTNGKHTHSGHSNQDIASGTSSKNRIVKGGDNTVSGFLLENGDHSHTVTIPASTTGSTGSGVGHNNLPPYITCYMWKRTA